MDLQAQRIWDKCSLGYNNVTRHCIIWNQVIYYMPPPLRTGTENCCQLLLYSRFIYLYQWGLTCSRTPNWQPGIHLTWMLVFGPVENVFSSSFVYRKTFFKVLSRSCSVYRELRWTHLLITVGPLYKLLVEVVGMFPVSCEANCYLLAQRSYPLRKAERSRHFIAPSFLKVFVNTFELN